MLPSCPVVGSLFLRGGKAVPRVGGTSHRSWEHEQLQELGQAPHRM